MESDHGAGLSGNGAGRSGFAARSPDTPAGKVSSGARISAVVIAENEQDVIGACLGSLAFCDEIIVVDGGSTDRTVSIAEQSLGALGALGANGRVIHHSSSLHGIHFNKNLGAAAATGDWVLSIDADETVSQELAREISKVVKAGMSGPMENRFPCFRIPRKTYFLGKWIRHSGWWPGYVVRLWRKGHTEWPLEVHRVPDPKGKCGTLESPLEHHSYRDLNDWGRKVLHFSGCEAVEAKNRGESLEGLSLIYALSFAPVAVFVRKLVFMWGWRDGIHGLVVAGSAAMATWLRAARRWEMDTLAARPNLGGRAGR